MKLSFGKLRLVAATVSWSFDHIYQTKCLLIKIRKVLVQVAADYVLFEF